jgi:hypothetical protein
MILTMLSVCMFFVCGLTVAHLVTSTQNIDTTQTSEGWGGTAYGSYDGYTHQLTINASVTPGSGGKLPTMTKIPYFFKAFNNGTELNATGTYLGTAIVQNGSILPFSTDLREFNVNDSNVSLNIAMGGTGYSSRFNLFGHTIFLTVDGDGRPDLNTSIIGSNATVNESDSYKFKLKLNDSMGYPVNNALIILSVNGVDYTVTTSDDGCAYYDFTNIKEDMNITASFNGFEGSDVWYLPTTANFLITVNPALHDNNSTNGTGGNGFDGLPGTGIPILVLVLAIVGGVYYYKRK